MNISNTTIKKIYRKWRDRKNFFFNLNRSFHKWLILNSSNKNPASIPYISGDTFRSIANHVFDEIDTINPSEVNVNDIVFVKISKIEEFFAKIHPKINNRYVLITHNEDATVDEKHAVFIDEKIIKWYGQNINAVHPKLVSIPIGLENFDHYNNGILKNFDRIRRLRVKKKNTILYGFSIGTNPAERQKAFDTLNKLPNAEKITGWPNAKKYLRLLAGYKFVASPPGNGIDCVRTWEALCVGTIPIVKSSILTRFYYDLNLPILLVNDWSELQSFSKKDLENKYEALKSRFENPAIYFDYWLRKIQNHD